MVSPPLTQAAGPPDPNKLTLVRLNQYGGLHVAQKAVSAPGVEILPTEQPVNGSLNSPAPRAPAARGQDRVPSHGVSLADEPRLTGGCLGAIRP